VRIAARGVFHDSKKKISNLLVEAGFSLVTVADFVVTEQPQEVVKVLRQLGYSAYLRTVEDGKALIQSEALGLLSDDDEFKMALEGRL